MTSRRAFRVAIVGAGPAGAATAILLAAEGAEVVLFAEAERREVLVGESLIPAIVPSLRRLGVEEAVAAISQHKPGVSFVWAGIRVEFTFARYGGRMIPYAYNIPRPEFDDVLRARAIALGVDVVPARARLGRGEPGAPELVLDDTARGLTPWGGAHPDLLIDATGRARVGARLLGIQARLGPRDDVAHFAHFGDVVWDEVPGQVIIGRVPGGWSWRIPLRDRLSVGVVLNRHAAARFGSTPESRLEGAIAAAPDLSATLRTARRISGVATYANYQLVTTRGVGPGWAAVGDAFGFVDPMLSTGVMVGLRSAELLVAGLAPVLRAHRDGQSPPSIEGSLQTYGPQLTTLLDAWMELVEYLYDGRMMAMVKAGLDMMDARGDWLSRLVCGQAEKNVALLATGTSILSSRRRGALRLLGRYGLRGVSPQALAIG